MKTIRLLLLALIAILAAIQLIPVARENPPVTADIQAPANVKELFERSCYDCHSNETVWPWYSKIAPVSWLVSRDVDHARKHLNFSEWESLPADKKLRTAGEIWDEVAEGEMPLNLYVSMHPQTELSAVEKEAIRLWSSDVQKPQSTTDSLTSPDSIAH